MKQDEFNRKLGIAVAILEEYFDTAPVIVLVDDEPRARTVHPGRSVPVPDANHVWTDPTTGIQWYCASAFSIRSGREVRAMRRVPTTLTDRPDDYDYIRRYYKAPAAVGRRVMAGGVPGVLLPPKPGCGHYIHFLPDGAAFSEVDHPTYETVYYDADGESILADYRKWKGAAS